MILLEDLRPSWQHDAACRGRGELWFGSDTVSPMVAAAVCRTCPVRIPCASYALELVTRGEALHGVWAGVRAGDVDGLRAITGDAVAPQTAPADAHALAVGISTASDLAFCGRGGGI
jgi:hypothetical protein